MPGISTSYTPMHCTPTLRTPVHAAHAHVKYTHIMDDHAVQTTLCENACTNKVIVDLLSLTKNIIIGLLNRNEQIDKLVLFRPKNKLNNNRLVNNDLDYKKTNGCLLTIASNQISDSRNLLTYRENTCLHNAIQLIRSYSMFFRLLGGPEVLQ